MKNIIIALTGTPGTGKTISSKKIKGFRTIELNKEITNHKLYSSYDRKRGTYIADMREIRRFVKNNLATGAWIVDSHLSHLLPPSIIDMVIVLRCDPKKLETRLKKRGWTKKKVIENVEAELMGIISTEARERHKKVHDIDTTGKSIKEVRNMVGRAARGAGKENLMIEWMNKDKNIV